MRITDQTTFVFCVITPWEKGLKKALLEEARLLKLDLFCLEIDT